MKCKYNIQLLKNLKVSKGIGDGSSVLVKKISVLQKNENICHHMLSESKPIK